jgi:hypothetical protein
MLAGKNQPVREFDAPNFGPDGGLRPGGDAATCFDDAGAAGEATTGQDVGATSDALDAGTE